MYLTVNYNKTVISLDNLLCKSQAIIKEINYITVLNNSIM